LVLRQQLTVLDFVSYCGGSLGLFLGFSAMSAVEIVYYMTLNVVCVKRREKRVASVDENDKASNKAKFVTEFLGSSSIHGCNQIVMEKRHFVER
jgi:hypothetical protein